MTQEDIRKEFYELYNMMASSHDVSFMRTFGNVHKEMMEWMIANNPSEAQAWVEKLSSIKWHNYLTANEASAIISSMKPQAPWKRDEWADAMDSHGFEKEEVPCYNSCALYVTMSMIYTDSYNTLSKYVGEEELFSVIHDLAVDKLKDADKNFHVRSYFGL